MIDQDLLKELLRGLQANNASSFKSDKMQMWNEASKMVTKPDHPMGMFEIQSIGSVHTGLRLFERQWIPKDKDAARHELNFLDMFSNFFIETARAWMRSAFSAAYKIERGDVFQKRNLRSFKGELNPLRCAFEKGHVDGNKHIGCFPEIIANREPYHCLGWVVPDKEMSLREYYRVDIAERFIEALLAEE